MKYKVGDKVKVKSKEWFDLNYNGSFINCGSRAFTEEMSKYCGQILTIREVSEELAKYLTEGNRYNWTDEMFEDATPSESLGERIHKFKQVYSSGCIYISDQPLPPSEVWDGVRHRISVKTHHINLIGKHKSLTLKIKS